ncbi:MAG: hypothetical protein ACTHKV_13955, partial [Flavipsychrobacter sp.]
MPDKELPRFVVYQPNSNEFYICFEAGGKFIRWCSNYAPSMDVRFHREISKIKDIAVKDLPKKGIFDQGTYETTKSDSRSATEKKAAEAAKTGSFVFRLNGKILKGRFAFKKMYDDIVIQKYKDKYAVTEDVLSGDLLRTIKTSVPDYDATKISLHHPKRTKAENQKVELPEEEVEEVTSDKKIGRTNYHFAFYTSVDEPEICLVTGGKEKALIFMRQGKRWVSLLPFTVPVAN